MSQININVNVSGIELLDQSRIQQEASRRGQLEKENRQRLEAEARAERAAALAAQGKDANGDPISGRFGRSVSDDRPTTPARAIKKLPYFYWRRDYNTSTQQVEYKFKSGNGLASATCSFSNQELILQFTDQLPPLAETLDIDIDENWDVSSFTNKNSVTATRQEVVYQPLPVARYFITTELYEADRDINTLGSERQFILPMGDGTAIFVICCYQAAKSARIQYYQKTYQVWSTSGGTLGSMLSEELQALTYENFEEIPLTTSTQIFCYRVGHQVCSQIEVPVSLSLAIENLIPEAEVIPSSQETAVPACGSSISCIGYPVDEFITVETTILAWPDANTYGTLDGMPANLGYGVTYQGKIVAGQCSPAVWFALVSKKNDKALAGGSHINAQTDLDPVSNKSFASLFKPTTYIGLPIEPQGKFENEFALDLSVPPALRLLKYSGSSYMSGPINAQAYPYTLPAWIASVIRIPSSDAINADPTELWFRSFIYDWGQKYFCLEQRALYGIGYGPP